MAIKVSTYQQKTQGARLNVPPPALQRATLDHRNTGDQMGIKSALNSAEKLGDAFAKEEADKIQARRTADILDEVNAYQEETRVFEADYRKRFKGKDALNVEADTEAFHRDQLKVRGQRFVNDPEMMVAWEQQASQINFGSLGRATSYYSQQDAVYREDVTKGLTATFLQKVPELGGNDKAVANLAAQHYDRVQKLNPGRDMTAYFAEVDLNIATTRIRGAVARDDVAEARRLFNSYRTVLGASSDEVEAQVRGAEINKKAYDISEEIRISHPNATKSERDSLARKMSGGDREVDVAARTLIWRNSNDEERLIADRKKQFRNATLTMARDANDPEKRQQGLMWVALNAPDAAEQKWGEDRMRGGAQPPAVSPPEILKKARDWAKNEKGTDIDFATEFESKLAPQDFERYSKMLNKKGGVRIMQYESGLEKRLQQTYQNNTQKKTRETFQETMSLWVDEYEADNGRMPTDAELEAQEKLLHTKVMYNDNFLDSYEEAFLLGGIDPSDYNVDEVEEELKLQGIVEGTPGFEAKRTAMYRAYFAEKLRKQQ